MPIPQYILDKRKIIGQDWLFTPSVAAIVLDGAGRILLQHRTDHDLWGLPGGLLEPGEHPAEAVAREVKEETGVDVVPERVVGSFFFFMAYPQGDQVNAINITFACRVVGGKLEADGEESRDVGYFALHDLPENTVAFHHARIQAALKRTVPYFEDAFIHPDTCEYVNSIRQHIGYDLLMIFSVSVIVRNEYDDVLLIQQPDRSWQLPTGAAWLFEPPAQAVTRMMQEQTGLNVSPESITGVYGGDELILTDKNGDINAHTNATFTARVLGGALLDTEAMAYFALDDLPDSLDPHHQQRLSHAQQDSCYFYFGN